MSKRSSDSSHAADARGVFTFFRESLENFEQTASILPSQRFLVDAMVEWALPATASVIVELGPGEGVITRPLLAKMRPDARLFAIEINERFLTELGRRIEDRRLTPVLGSAEYIGELLAERGFTGKVDAVVSGLGLSLIPGPVRERILESARSVLAPHGVYVQFGYVHTRFLVYSRESGYSRFHYRKTLAKHFPRLERRAVPLNAPPAYVYRGRVG